jgi:hypothetical protein
MIDCPLCGQQHGEFYSCRDKNGNELSLIKRLHEAENLRERLSNQPKAKTGEPLLPCANCGAEAAKHCVITLRKYYNSDDVRYTECTARCNSCGYTISITTSKSPRLIRDLWNVRNTFKRSY